MAAFEGGSSHGRYPNGHFPTPVEEQLRATLVQQLPRMASLVSVHLGGGLCSGDVFTALGQLSKLRDVDIMGWASRVVASGIGQDVLSDANDLLFPSITCLRGQAAMVQLFRKRPRSTRTPWQFTDIYVLLDADQHEKEATSLFDTISQYRHTLEFLTIRFTTRDVLPILDILAPIESCRNLLFLDVQGFTAQHHEVGNVVEAWPRLVGIQWRPRIGPGFAASCSLQTIHSLSVKCPDLMVIDIAIDTSRGATPATVYGLLDGLKRLYVGQWTVRMEDTPKIAVMLASIKPPRDPHPWALVRVTQ